MYSSSTVSLINKEKTMSIYLLLQPPLFVLVPNQYNRYNRQSETDNSFSEIPPNISGYSRKIQFGAEK